MPPNPVVWFEIYVADMERARRFYETVLDVTLEHKASAELGDPEFWLFPSQGTKYGAQGALAKMEGFKPSGVGVIVYFACADCAAASARAIANGGSVIRDRFAIGEHGYIAIVTDSEGNLLGLQSPT